MSYYSGNFQSGSSKWANNMAYAHTPEPPFRTPMEVLKSDLSDQMKVVWLTAFRGFTEKKAIRRVEKWNETGE